MPKTQAWRRVFYSFGKLHFSSSSNYFFSAIYCAFKPAEFFLYPTISSAFRISIKTSLEKVRWPLASSFSRNSFTPVACRGINNKTQKAVSQRFLCCCCAEIKNDLINKKYFFCEFRCRRYRNRKEKKWNSNSNSIAFLKSAQNNCCCSFVFCPCDYRYLKSLRHIAGRPKHWKLHFVVLVMLNLSGRYVWTSSYFFSFDGIYTIAMYLL